MDDLPRKVSCSRGLTRSETDRSAPCTYIENGEIYTCAAYVCISGKNPNTGEDYHEEWRCTDTWIPILLVEGARTNRGQTAAIESLRNIVATGSDQAQQKLDQRLEETRRIGHHD